MISNDLADLADRLAGRAQSNLGASPGYCGLLAEVLCDLALQARSLEEHVARPWGRLAPVEEEARE